MRISNLHIKNFRSIRELEIGFEEVTALLGGNNVGKSTILRAMEMFFEPAPRVATDDYHNRGDDDIEITITFSDLVPAEFEEFGNAVVSGTLTVRRFFSTQRDDNLQYEVLAKTYPPFAEVRQISNKTDKRAKFNEIAASTEGLEKVRSADAADAAMLVWEREHPDRLELAYRRGFFGAPNVASGKLRKKTSLHLVQAVADASEQTSDLKKSPIMSLLSEISKQTYENNKEVHEFVEQAKEQFSELVDPKKFPELGGISDLLTEAVHRYYKDSKLLADWQLQEGIAVDFPRPTIKVESHGFQTALENVGHGLQRASLFAIIQFLAERSSVDSQDGGFDQPQSDIILLVEEPEIYQHPLKQLVISETFHKICKKFNKSTGLRFQIIFSTHSEKFVGMHKFQSARILRRSNGGGTQSHFAKAISVKQCCDYFANLLGKEPMPEATFEAKMHIFSREVCEGFFADKVILVEGVTDKAVLDGFFRSRDRDAIAEGIAIIPVEGKTKMDKPLYIFSELGIPTYPVFDSDKSKNKNNQKTETNFLLQKIVGIEHPEEFPSGVFSNLCAFECDLEQYLKEIIGDEEYNKMFDIVFKNLGLPRDELCKTPLAVAELVALARSRRMKFELFDHLLDAVDQISS